MWKRSSAILMAFAALGASLSHADADVFTPISYESFASFESRVVELENRVADIEAHGGSSSCDVGDSCCSPCPGVSFLAEVIWLRPYDSEDGNLGSSHQSGSRYTVGYEGSGGWSGRLRYFEWSSRPAGAATFLNIEVFDAEVAGRFSLGCGWCGTAGGGFRYAHYRDDGVVNFRDTYGPVASVEMGRTFRCNIRLYGIARQSYQFGQDVENNTGDTMIGISELQLGGEWNREVCGRNIVVRSFVEAQRWAGPEDNDSEDFGLVGAGLALGITR